MKTTWQIDRISVDWIPDDILTEEAHTPIFSVVCRAYISRLDRNGERVTKCLSTNGYHGVCADGTEEIVARDELAELKKFLERRRVSLYFFDEKAEESLQEMTVD